MSYVPPGHYITAGSSPRHEHSIHIDRHGIHIDHHHGIPYHHQPPTVIVQQPPPPPPMVMVPPPPPPPTIITAPVEAVCAANYPPSYPQPPTYYPPGHYPY